jgi:hypothetical protein
MLPLLFITFLSAQMKTWSGFEVSFETGQVRLH